MGEDDESEDHDGPGRLVEQRGRSGQLWTGQEVVMDTGRWIGLVWFSQLIPQGTMLTCSVGLPGVIPGMSEGRHVVIVDIFYWSTQGTRLP